MAPAFALIMKHIPRNAESFSSLSRIFLKEVHHGRINSPKNGATSLLQCSPNRPRVIPVFSSNVFGVETRREISINGGRTVFLKFKKCLIWKWIETLEIMVYNNSKKMMTFLFFGFVPAQTKYLTVLLQYVISYKNRLKYYCYFKVRLQCITAVLSYIRTYRVRSGHIISFRWKNNTERETKNNGDKT